MKLKKRNWFLITQHINFGSCFVPYKTLFNYLFVSRIVPKVLNVGSFKNLLFLNFSKFCQKLYILFLLLSFFIALNPLFQSNLLSNRTSFLAHNYRLTTQLTNSCPGRVYLFKDGNNVLKKREVCVFIFQRYHKGKIGKAIQKQSILFLLLHY